MMNHKLFESVVRLWNTRDELSVKNIRLDYWHYFLAFPIIMVINNVSEGFFQYDITPFGIGLYAFLFGATEIAALLTVMSPVRYLKKYVVVWPVCLLVGTLFCMLLPKGQLWLLFAACYWVGMGGCAVCAFYAYVFVLKNAERFIGIVLIAVNIGLDVFLYESGYASMLVKNILLGVMVVAVTACVFRYKLALYLPKHSREEAKRRIPLSAHSIIICIAVFSIIIMLGDCGMLSVVGEGHAGHLLFGVGNIVAALLAIVMQIVFHRSIWHSWNLFLGFSIIGLGLMMLRNEAAIECGALLYGLARGMGNISLFYLGGGLLKKYSSLALFKRNILCFCLLMTLFNTVSQIMSVYMPGYVIYIAFFVSILLMVLCMLASPVFFQHVFFNEWMDEYHSMDMTVINEQIERAGKFENLGLSPREKEVAAHLLRGLTFRQISTELGIAESTVNGYSSSLYKKLGINSRTELLIRFGVENDNGDNIESIFPRQKNRKIK